ncbi:BspA family leucine-rich repeat surface protein [Companilactobacillus bobalius]|nr:BspA family leucine-rich repeat surface protein [Companilactobacillus bobalius]KAE9561760.1 hypothetical protein ATN92_06715 [Companilactobacillus bobalius]KRK82678.1 hypothetical protein FC78_GL002690 [Companilactobacillus bobalius DSM 19674]GEO57573.1 hypothetical protein LBO01_07020 [Companilactobacillus paralimentarius]
MTVFETNEIQAATTNDVQQLLNQNAANLMNNESLAQTDDMLPTAATITYSGVNGTANWDIDSTGKLTVHAGQLAYGMGNWKNYASSIKSVYVEDGVKVNNDFVTSNGNNGVFSNLENVTTIDVTNLDVSAASTLGYMFSGDKKLTEIIGLEAWKTSKVTWLGSMFYDNNSLKSLDLSNFDTSHVNNFFGMFMNCYSLEYLNISGFDTSEADSLNLLFLGVPGEIVGLKGFDTSNVTSMRSTFQNVNFIKNDPDDIKDWDVSRVTDMSSLFNKSKFNELDLSKWDIGKVTDMSSMFNGDSNVSQVKGIREWDTSNVENMSSMFAGVTDSDLSMVNDWNVSNVTSMYSMFGDCSNLAELDLSNWNTPKLNHTGSMFSNDKLLSEDTLKGYETLVTDKTLRMGSMFSGTGFKTIDLSQYDTSNVEDLSSVFMGTTKLQKIIGTFDTSSVVDMTALFNGSAITDFDGLNIADWDTSKVEKMSRMFLATSISNFDFLKDWDTSSLTDLNSTFSKNTKAKTIPLVNWDVSKVGSFYLTFNGSSALESLPIENWNVTSATTMYGMFWSASSLKKLDFSKWNTPNVKSFYAMLNSTSGLETVDLSGLDTTNATDMSYFFGLEHNLWKITLGPKSVMKNLQGQPNTTGVQFPTPVVGKKINDSSTSESYSAISDKWQEVDYANGGSDHQPVGNLFSAQEIVDQFSNAGNPITTYVWQQHPIINIKMQVPDIDFGKINNAPQIFHRKNKDFAITINNNNYPADKVVSKITVSLSEPLTTADGQNTLENALVYREKKKSSQILSGTPTTIYEDEIPDGVSSINWDDDDGILLDMNNESYAKSDNYSTTLNWTMVNSL